MFNVGHALWLDFETKSPVTLKTAGACRYANDPGTAAIVLAYAIDGEPAKTWHNNGAILNWADAPDDLVAAYSSDRLLMAYNAGFDREVWNYSTIGFPPLGPDRLLDAMAQATASNLPADLDGASTRLGGPGKQADGKALVKLFSIEGADPANHLEEWERFLAYARQDVETMQQVIQWTRPLPESEWLEYIAFERVSERGIGIDPVFTERAARLAAEDRIHSGRRLAELTDNVVTAVTQASRIADWLHSALPSAAARSILEIADDDEDDEELDETPKPNLSLQRKQVTKLRLWLETKRQNDGLTEAEKAAEEVATLREFGASAAPAKFARMVAQHVEGVIANQYIFGGAPQTGRMSSRGIQIHNLARETVGPRDTEAALVDMIADGCSYAEFAAAEPTTMPVARKLGLLVRPALMASAARIFAWSDWSAVEARITAWLAQSIGGDTVLDVFRANDADPNLPDIYEVAAAGIYGKAAKDITPAERQTGKVATLALGFGGGRRALQHMAANYGLFLDDDTAQDIVDRWRRENQWAVQFWGVHNHEASTGLWGAAMGAWESPRTIAAAGRIAFTYEPDYLNGTLFLCLPSGRLLTYPEPTWRTVPVLDDKGKQTGEREELSFLRSYGRAKLWRGTLVENSVQGAAADLLRGTVRRLEENSALSWMPVRAHTHDEILVEVDERRADEAKAILHQHMVEGFAWSDGLPLAAEEIIAQWYTKAPLHDH